MIDADLGSELHRTFAKALDRSDPAEARDHLLAAGWLDALNADEPFAVAIAFRLQGETGRDAALLDDVVAYHLCRHWPEVIGDLSIAYPVVGHSSDGLPGVNVVLPGHRRTKRLLWLKDLGGNSMEVIELDGELVGSVGRGVDPYYNLLALSGPPSGQTRQLPGSDETGSAWDEALAAGRLALAHQMVGGAGKILEMALEYAQTRKQFGTPIGAFQAVKHRMAETQVAISAANAASLAAASTKTPSGAALAKVLAGRAATAAAKNCLQVFGGIGFTMEHDFHRYMRRNMVLDRLLGDPRTLERQIGQQVRAGCLRDDRIVDLHHLFRIELLLPRSTPI